MTTATFEFAIIAVCPYCDVDIHACFLLYVQTAMGTSTVYEEATYLCRLSYVHFVTPGDSDSEQTRAHELVSL
jgi:hypothetical protein